MFVATGAIVLGEAWRSCYTMRPLLAKATEAHGPTTPTGSARRNWRNYTAYSVLVGALTPGLVDAFPSRDNPLPYLPRVSDGAGAQQPGRPRAPYAEDERKDRQAGAAASKWVEVSIQKS